MVRFFLGVYHTLHIFTYTTCARGDNLNTKIINHQKGKINIIFNDVHQAHTHKTNDFKVIDSHFSHLIGLDHIKQIAGEIYAMKVMNEKRLDKTLAVSNHVLHMVFKGNPGTGKTTVARELGKLFFKLNILSKGHFIEAERADIVGEYIGQTAQKTRAMVQKALGGILFIDEAYALVRGGRKDFGREAIDTLVKQMEDHHNDFILILAGYPNEMDLFNLANPGLESRFPFHVTFADYSVKQLADIAKQMAYDREYELTDNALLKLQRKLRSIQQEPVRNFSNARFIRNVIEKSIRQQALRLVHNQTYEINDLLYLSDDDITFD